MITAKDLTKSYTGDNILEEVDFKIGGNRKIGVVGRNGCGKSTLFKLVTKEIAQDSGNLEVQDEIIGYIPQELLFPNELVGEYLEKKIRTLI